MKFYEKKENILYDDYRLFMYNNMLEKNSVNWKQHWKFDKLNKKFVYNFYLEYCNAYIILVHSSFLICIEF